MEDIEADLGVLHDLSIEINDCLNDLDMGHGWCRDVPAEGSAVLDEPHVSPPISTVRGGEGLVPLITTVKKDEVLLPLQVHGQRARRSRLFRVNIPTDPHGLTQS